MTYCLNQVSLLLQCSYAKINKIAVLTLKLRIFAYSLILSILGAQKDHLIETVILSTHSIFFG